MNFKQGPGFTCRATTTRKKTSGTAGIYRKKTVNQLKLKFFFDCILFLWLAPFHKRTQKKAKQTIQIQFWVRPNLNLIFFVVGFFIFVLEESWTWNNERLENQLRKHTHTHGQFDVLLCGFTAAAADLLLGPCFGFGCSHFLSDDRSASRTRWRWWWSSFTHCVAPDKQAQATTTTTTIHPLHRPKISSIKRESGTDHHNRIESTVFYDFYCCCPWSFRSCCFLGQ